MEVAKLCKTETRKRSKELRETVASGSTHPHKKTKYACIVEVPQGSVWILLFREIMTITSQRKGSTLLLITIWCSRVIPMLQAMKIPDAKAAVDKRMGQAREDPCVVYGQGEEQERRYS